MSDLFRVNWQAINLASGVKISLGLVVMMMLTHLTGEPWLVTALVAMIGISLLHFWHKRKSSA
jgi:hypothetical protein